MKQKGFISLPILLILLVVVGGVVGYIALNTNGNQTEKTFLPFTKPTKTTTNNDVVKNDDATPTASIESTEGTTLKTLLQAQQSKPSNQSGAGGSGIGTYVEGKFCTSSSNQIQNIHDVVYGENLVLSADKKSILMDGKTAVILSELPVHISVSTDKSIDVTNSAFTSAVVSPTKSYIAFTVSGGGSGWGGVMGVSSGIISPISYQYKGSVASPKWSYDSRYVVFSKVMPSGLRVLALGDTQDQAPVLSAREKILDFTTINPLPAGIFSDLSDYFWSQNKDNKVYFVVTTKSHGIDHGEIWSFNSGEPKWDFICYLGETSAPGSGDSAG